MPKSVLRAVLGRIQFTLHAIRRTPHGASRLVQAMSAWSVNTRRAPSRDARVYGHTTTAMHKLSTPPPTLPCPPLPPASALRPSQQNVAMQLVHAAIRAGSMDDISVVVVTFQATEDKSPPGSRRDQRKGSNRTTRDPSTEGEEDNNAPKSTTAR